MAVYYYNGAKILAPLSITSNRPIYDAETISLKKIRASQNHQRWELSFECVANDNAGDTFIDSIKDLTSSSSMPMPQIKEVEDASNLRGTALVASDVVAGDSSVPILKDNNISGILKKGSFIKFGNYPKVYVLTDDLNMNTPDNNGQYVAKIFPNLVLGVSVSGAVGARELNYGTACEITYFKDVTNLQGITFSDGILANMGTINLIEAL